MSRSEPQANISGWAIRNPVPTIVLFILLSVAGLFSFPGLRINNTPDLDLPAVVVTVSQPGAAPAELETQVTRRIEDSVAGLGDVKHISSTVVDGTSTTVIEFAMGKNIDRAVNDVRDKVTQTRSDLPADVKEPVVTRIEASGGAILTYTVRADAMAGEQLSWFIDDTVSKALLAVPGVAQVSRVGGVDREIRVHLDPDRLLALGISAADVNSQLRDLNINRPGGRGALGHSEQSIRTLGTAASVEDLRHRPITLPGGRTARLGELGRVEDATAEMRMGALLDNKPVVAFEVMRTRGSSEVAVAARVERRVEALAQVHPGTHFQKVATTTAFVQASYHAAADALLVGSVLAMAVVLLFLRDWRATLIASLAMPLSLIPTFFVMRLLDYALSNVTLLALTLVVGVLVDDAIVEIENIVRHMRSDRASPYRAALDAAAEIGLAVMATTATIIAVFVPVAFMPGIPGQFFRQFGITVVAAVLFSLVVARLLTPLMGAFLLKPGAGGHDEREGRVMRFYLGLLGWCLRYRWLTLLGGLGFFAASLAMVPLMPKDFVPASDRGRVALALELAPGGTLADTEAVTRRVTDILKAQPEVAIVFASLGTAQANASGGPPIGTSTHAGDPRSANMVATLVPRGQRSRSQQQLEAALRPEIAALPGVRVSFGGAGEGTVKASVTLVGEEPDTLEKTARELERQMRAIPALAAARSTASLSRPELRIVPLSDRAAELGVSVAAIAQAARMATLGDVDANLAKFNLPARQVPIRVMLDERARADLAVLRGLRVPGTSGRPVPLSAVAEIGFGAGPAQIERLDRTRKITVQAELAGMPLGQANALIESLPVMRALPASVHVRNTGDQENMAELFSGFAVALTSGVLLVYTVLVVLFGGFIQPLTIMTALPLSLGGALMALMLTGKALGVSSIIGILMLMGIVAKNSILLVEYAVVARGEGLDRAEALMEAARKRARPIVMTTIAMTAGMAHIAMGIGADSEFRAPMAICVIGGLITSTLLSLVFVPVVFTYMDDLEGWVSRRLGGLLTSGPEDDAAPPQPVSQAAE